MKEGEFLYDAVDHTLTAERLYAIVGETLRIVCNSFPPPLGQTIARQVRHFPTVEICGQEDI